MVSDADTTAPLDAAPDSELGRARARLAARDATIAELEARRKALGERDAAARRELDALTVDAPREAFVEAAAARIFRELAGPELSRLSTELARQRELRREDASVAAQVERQAHNDLRELRQMGVNVDEIAGRASERLRRALGGEP